MMVKIREMIRRYMIGRYARLDSLSKFLLVAALVCNLIVQFNSTKKIGVLFYFASIGLLLYLYIRFMSRDCAKRVAENQAFLEKTAWIRDFFRGQSNQSGNTKDHRIYKCPSCGQKIRVPRGKGRIEICCPKCGRKFIKRS